MRDEMTGPPDDRPSRYEIVVGGRLDEGWSDWLSGMEIECGDGRTTLVGLIDDQPALLGILVRLGNMNLTLISLRRLEGMGSDPSQPRGRGGEEEEA
jgi:hypothetical protein